MSTEPVPSLGNQAKVDVPAELIGHAGVASPPRVMAGPELASQCEEVYRHANWDSGRVPWCRSGADPLLVEWLNSQAPLLVRPGSRAVVVGVGLGDDLAAIHQRGYDVLGFDVSPTAVNWASRRHPACAEHFVCADLFNLPARLRKRFDLVVEVRTLQQLPPGLRVDALSAIAELMSPRGVVLVVTRARPPERALNAYVSQPFPFTRQELLAAAAGAGLMPIRGEGGVEDHYVDETPHLRAVFARG
jgi:hypothetical protein